MRTAELITTETTNRPAVLDEQGKREVRRASLAALAVPGYQVPFGSREMPVARGWGSGGLQVTLALGGPDDVVKVIDQGDEEGVNAVNLRRLIRGALGCRASADTREASIVQSRHRIPEDRMRAGQTLVLQVPVSEPLRRVEKSVLECRRMHAEADYSRIWVAMYEQLAIGGLITTGAGYPSWSTTATSWRPVPSRGGTSPDSTMPSTSRCCATAATRSCTPCPRTPTSNPWCSTTCPSRSSTPATVVPCARARRPTSCPPPTAGSCAVTWSGAPECARATSMRPSTRRWHRASTTPVRSSARRAVPSRSGPTTEPH